MSEPNRDDEPIKLGIVNVPKNQLFPIVLALVLLSSGVPGVVATTDAFRLTGLIAIIVGLGWAGLIYQNVQNQRTAARHEAVRDAEREYDITLIVLLPDGQPVKGALGPVKFTDRKTNTDGRVIYKYTGQDQINYRNQAVRFTAREKLPTLFANRVRIEQAKLVSLNSAALGATYHFMERYLVPDSFSGSRPFVRL